ncbi:DUF1837 domain-containing protein [Lysinibacillus xylanilyticus]|uniref:DUF1837 domain-containing protein n=1 Tax=Lysinibacillus xylanilyticus TaxID=582475 RepID=A0ABV3W4Z4_9BACI
MTTISPVFESDLILDEYIAETHFRGFSVGYEDSEYRYDALVELIFSALTDFSLTEKEKSNINPFNAQRKLKKAAKVIYATEKYSRRGEFGEILLHIIMRDYFNSIPAISKMYYKDGANETVKGFDAVHVVPIGKELELWLGEVKFYNNMAKAIRDVLPELQAHTNKDYLRSEFLFISNKVDDTWEHAENFLKLIDGRISMDKIFSKIRIPVLLTYDSKVVNSYRDACEDYKKELINELHKHHDTFRGNDLPKNVEIILILLPIEQKAKLVQNLHDKLRIWQQI